MKGTLLNLGDNSIESIDLPDKIFASEPKKYTIYLAARRHLANMRRGTADTKERGEVSYSTQKLRPQKGTGRSRQGSRSSIIWKGGAVAFGPRPRDFQLKMNKKEIRQAIFSALSLKLRDEELFIVDGIKIEGKTKEVKQLLDKIKTISNKELGSVLFVYSEENGNVEVAARNINYCKAVEYKYLNVYDLLSYSSVVFSREAVALLEGWWSHD